MSKENVHPNTHVKTVVQEGKEILQSAAKELSTWESTAGKPIETIQEENFSENLSHQPEEKIQVGCSPRLPKLSAIVKKGDRFIPMRQKSIDQEYNNMILNNSSHAESSCIDQSRQASIASAEEVKGAPREFDLIAQVNTTERQKKPVHLDDRNQLLASTFVKKQSR